MEPDLIPDPCEHIKDNGLRCGSPAMRGHDFCYYHRRLHTTVLPGDSNYVLPALETEHAVELAVTHIVRAMLKGKIDRADALAMFAGIRIAQNSIRNAEDPVLHSFHEIQYELTPGMEKLEASAQQCGTDIPVCAGATVGTQGHVEEDVSPTKHLCISQVELANDVVASETAVAIDDEREHVMVKRGRTPESNHPFTAHLATERSTEFPPRSLSFRVRSARNPYRHTTFRQPAPQCTSLAPANAIDLRRTRL